MLTTTLLGAREFGAHAPRHFVSQFTPYVAHPCNNPLVLAYGLLNDDLVCFCLHQLICCIGLHQGWYLGISNSDGNAYHSLTAVCATCQSMFSCILWLIMQDNGFKYQTMKVWRILLTFNNHQGYLTIMSLRCNTTFNVLYYVYFHEALRINFNTMSNSKYVTMLLIHPCPIDLQLLFWLCRNVMWWW